MADPVGTCHLVGCPGKGVHPPHTLKNSLDFLAQLGAELEEKANRTAEWIRDMTEPIADKTFTRIGVGKWEDYEHGGQPYCIGFAQLRVETQTNVVTAFCSIAGEGAWGLLLTSGVYNPAGLTDRHRAECPNRKARPDG